MSRLKTLKRKEKEYSLKKRELNKRLSSLTKEIQNLDKKIVHNQDMILKCKRNLAQKKKVEDHKQKPVNISTAVYNMYRSQYGQKSKYLIGQEMNAAVVSAVREKRSGTYTHPDKGMVVTVIDGVITSIK